MIDFKTVDRLVIKAQRPIDDPWPESLRVKFNEPHNYYRFLYYLALEIRPRTILEIGTQYGIGSAYLAAAAHTYAASVIGVDLNSHEVTGTLINSRYGNYHFVEGDSTGQETARQVFELAGKLGPIGLVFQDSSHHYLESWQEWQLYSRLTDTNLIWICDDITPAFHDPLVDPPGKSMVQYFEELPGAKRLYRDSLHTGNTVGVVLWPA